MRVESMPGCCVGMVIYELDSEWTRQHTYLNDVTPVSKEEIEINLQATIKRLKGSFVVATTNSNQITVEELLEKFGFKRVDSVPSLTHNTTVSFWYKNLLR